MVDDTTFASLIRRVRAGDDRAAAAVVQQYEPQIRRLVRMRLTDPRLRSVLDSVDVCQSVLANFFVRAAAGQFDLDSPEQLLKLLAKMARNKLLNLVEKHQAQKCDYRRRLADGAEALDAAPAAQATPSRILVGKELLAQARLLLSEEELYLVDQRVQGRGWAEIAVESGTTADALRKKLTRALDRVSQALNLEEVLHE